MSFSFPNNIMSQSHHQSFRLSISQRDAGSSWKRDTFMEGIGELEKQLTGCVFNVDYVKQVHTRVLFCETKNQHLHPSDEKAILAVVK